MDAFATRAEIKALNTGLVTVAYLKEAGREGQFIWRTGDYSAEVAADAAEYNYITGDGIAATVGAWVRATGDRAIVKPAHAGGVYRSLSERFSEIFNVKDFGAQGIGTDDTAAFDAAIAAMGEFGGEIFIPPGRYVLSGPLTVTNKPVVFRGCGVKISQLFFSVAGHGIDYNTDDLSDFVQVIDCSVIALTTTNGYGVNLNFPSNQGSSWKNATLRDIVIDGATSVSDYQFGNGSQGIGQGRFGTGIRANNVAGFRADNLHVRGNFSAKDTVGILFEGWTVDFALTRSWLPFHDTALRKRGSLEGFNIDGIVAVSCNQFVDIQTVGNGSDTQGGVWGHIQNCHSGNSFRNIDIRGYPQTFILNNVLYCDSADGNFAHVYVDNCSDTIISGNKMLINVDGGSPNGYGIQAFDSPRMQIIGNNIRERFFAWQLDANCTDALISSNIYSGIAAHPADAVLSGNNPI